MNWSPCERRGVILILVLSIVAYAQIVQRVIEATS